MYQFFVKNDNMIPEGGSVWGTVRIEGSDVNHIANVLRMKIGEKIRVSSEDGISAVCRLSEIRPDYCLAEIIETDTEGTELPNRITLFQGLPKGDKMELIIQKAVELGAYRIVPVAMKNCVMKLDPKKVPRKVERWQAIAESAAKQSKRTLIPQVTAPLTFQQALQSMCELDIRLVPYENQRGMEASRKTMGSIRKGQSVGILVGPEGGISKEEILACDGIGAVTISLGRRILRTETAGPATLAMLVYELDQ